MEVGSRTEGLHVMCVCVCAPFLCLLGCQMLAADQIQEIAAACVSCHTMRDGGERKRWKDVYTLCYVMC